MTDDLTINVKANTTELQRAEKELNSFQKAFRSVNSALERSQSSFSQASAGITAAATAFQAVHLAVTQYIIAPLAGAVNSFVQLGDTISKTSQRIGIGVDSLGGLKFAAEQCGADFQTLTEGIKTFQSTLGAAQMGEASGISKLSNVGLSADAFAGLDNEQQLMKLADHIKSIGDKSQQTRVALELFGKAGFKLLPFFQEGAEGIQKLIAEGKDIGAVMGEEATADAVALADAMNRMKTSASNVSNVFLSSLAPSITSVLDGITSLAKGTSRFVKNNTVLITGIGASVAAFAALRAMVLGATTVIPALVAGFNALKVAMLSNPYLLAGAAIIGGIVAAWAMWNKAIKETEQRLKVMNEEAQKHEQAVLAANAADKKLFDRLQELADMEDPLNNEEVREAQALIDELEGKYGKLGITIDENTRKIHGMAQAQAILNKEMAQKEIDALEERKAALEARRDAIQDKISKNWKKDRKFLDMMYKNNGYTGNLSDQGKKKWADHQQLVQEFQSVNKEIAGLDTRQKALRGITNPEEATEPGKPQEQPKTLSQLNEESTAARNAQNEAKAELAKMKEDPDLDFRDPLTKAYADLAEKTQAKYDALDKKIELTRKAGGSEDDVAALEAQRAKIDQWNQQELEKIGQGVIDERQKQADEEYAQWKERNPELEKPEEKDARLVAAEAKVQEARDSQAEAILTGVGLEEADMELKSAEEGLAKTIAEVSGEARGKAKDEWQKAQKAYDDAKANGADSKTLNDLLQAVKEAKSKYETENEAYFAAVGSLRQQTEEDITDAVDTTLSSSGTFSAYGMDAAVESDIPAQTLDVLRKLLDNTDEIVEEQKNDGTFTK